MIAFALLLAAAPPVSLTIDPCAGVEVAEVRRILELELAATRASIRGLTGVVACDGDALAFEVEDPLTGKQLSRQVELARAAPNARARLLALAMVEAVEASWDEVLYAPVPAPLPEPEPDPAPPAVALPSPPLVGAVAEPVAPPDDGPRFRVSVVGASRALLDAPLWQWGGGVRFAHMPFRHVGWAAELSAEHGELGTFLGTVQMSSAGGSLEVVGQYAWRFLTFQHGFGVRGGGVTARGVPFGALITAKQVDGPWAGPYHALSVTAARGAWAVTGRFEGGVVVVGVPAHVAAVRTGMAGPWLGLSIAIGYGT